MTVIDVEHLHKQYGEKIAVDDVSLTVDEGEIFGILGRNGAGKTTTVECIMGLRRPDRGRIRVQLGFPRRSDIRHAYVQLDVISPHLAEPGHPRDRPVVWDRLIAVRYWPPYRAPPIAYLGAVRPRSGAARTSKC